jgi:uncharacterized protein YecT (DUF1311 family)
MKMRTVVACLLLAMANAAAEGPCNEDAPQQQLNKCAVRAAEAAEKMLLEIYSGAMHDVGSNRRAALQESQHTWVDHRNAQCALEASEATGGTLAPFIRAPCRERMAKERTLFLKELRQQSIDK